MSVLRSSAVDRQSLPALGAPPLPACGERVGVREAIEGLRLSRAPLTRIAARSDLSPRAGRGGVCLPSIGILTFLLCFLTAAFALTFPTLTGRVVDEADVIDATTREALTTKLAALEAKSTDQLVVVTLKSLQGTTIEDFGVQLGRHWQIGQKDKNNGVLLIVAPTERKVRIEVGYGLEGTLTDAVSRLIIENGILPRFRTNDFAGGITRGVDDIISVLTGDAEDWKQRANKRPDTVITGPTTQNDSVWGIVLIVLGVIAVIALCIFVSGVFCEFIFQILAAIVTSSGSSSSSSGGFSGGGGSFGGGGASGSW